MMNIVMLSILSVILALGTWLYLLYIGNGKDEETKVTWKELFKSRKAVHIYAAVMAVVLLSTVVVLCSVYKTNTIIWNVKMITILACIFCVAYVDYHEYIIPNKVILAGIIIRMMIWLFEFIVSPNTFFIIFKGDVIAAVIIVVFFLVCSFVIKEGIGMGDVKLMGLMALYHGLAGILSSIFFSMIAAFVGALFLLITHKKTKKDSIPFAPAILVGSVLAVVMTGL